MTPRKVIPLLIYLINAICSISFAQQKQGANWFIGVPPNPTTHVNFNGNQPVSTPATVAFVDSQFNGFGVSTISDRNGNLLFFSNQGHVVTRQLVNGVYQKMPNGDIFAATPNRTSWTDMVVQSPRDSNIYYIFILEGQSWGLPTSQNLFKVQIDMRLNNGYGDVVPNSLQLLRRNVSTFKLTALMHSNNLDTWVLTLNDKCDSTIAYLINSTGIQTPVVTKNTKPLESQKLTRLKASSNSEMFVASGLQGPVQPVELFDFNRTTGIPQHKFSLSANNVPVFCFDFSPDNTKLYVSALYIHHKATIYQFDLAAGSELQVQQSLNIIFQKDSIGFTDIQLGINGKLYFAGGRYLSQINCPNFYGNASNFKYQAVDLGQQANAFYLPTLNQTLFRNVNKLQAQASKNVICAGDTVQLTAYGAGAEQFKWEVANGLLASSDTLHSPVVNPTVTTTYKVTGSSVCSSDSAFVTVSVLPKIPGVTIAGPLQVVTLTEHEYVVQNPALGSTFNWQVAGGTIESGQGQSKIKVNWGAAGQGSVSVTEIPETGCNGETVSLKVKISEGPEPVIYNVFTPNNDGKNDAFVIENLKWYPGNELRIYNRWGVEVFKTNNYLNNWKADKVSAGTYYYRFTSNGRSWKGWVEVVK